MALRTVLFSFKPTSEPSSSESSVGALLRKYFPGLTQSQRVSLGDSNGFLVVFSAPSAPITFTLRYYQAEQLFTLNGEASQACEDFIKFNNVKMDNLKEDFEKTFNLEKLVEKLPVLKRNSTVPLYFLTSDNRAIEYDFDQVLVHERSSFQDIKILHSPTLGNALLLDDLQNLAEGDLGYTRGIMKYGENVYKDKEILILGGGDGGLLHELLKENPKFVTMVDIDGQVMKYCQIHLKGACGNSLDSLQGPNYQVIVGDCIEYMKQYIDQNKSFDYVFNDLTDIPISTKDNKDLFLENSSEMWQFVKQILELALKLVRPNSGKYLNHAIGVGCQSALEEYEQLLNSGISTKVKFSRHTAFVPSFVEEWVFYEVWKV